MSYRLTDDIPAHDTMVANIVREYNSTTDEVRAAGRNWYESANMHAEAIAEFGGFSADVAAAIIAGFSASTQWATNLRMAADTAINAEPAAHRFGGSTKARRLMGGENPDTVHKSEKLRNFYRTIADPELVASLVVVDRHAARTAMGIDGNVDKFVTNSKTNKMIQAAFHHAATIVNENVGHLQAIVWVPRAA